jgi:2,3-bisphosphoglycerate-dependent phosphoglycerate mutase
MSSSEASRRAIGRGSLVLLRHGRTEWNDRGLITGWADPPLTRAGEREAHRVGEFLRANGVSVSVVLTSMAQRAIDTASIVLEELGECQVARSADWRLNERHFGELQGLDRPTALERFGRPAVRDWKHDPHAAPPALRRSDPRHPRHDARYAEVDPRRLPGTETSEQLIARVGECWREVIDPHLEEGRSVLVVSHCHSLRALNSLLRADPDADPDADSTPPFRSPGSWHLYRCADPPRGCHESDATLIKG